MSVPWHLRCVQSGTTYDGLDVRYRGEGGSTLDVVHSHGPISLETFDSRRNSNDPVNRSGVWRFRELVLPLDPEFIVARGEGNTTLYSSPRVASYCGLDAIQLKHEGENPTGSFKDRGMTVAISAAKRLGMRAVACASTGNTSASMASYAAIAGLDAYVFIPDGKIAYGKLSQALAYGAKTLQIEGDFDAAMDLVQEVCASEGVYLVNSVNPYRLEGQKAIGLEILQDLGWEPPDWIVLPGGNLGNNSAITKALMELEELGLLRKKPRIAVVQAEGANPLFTAWSEGKDMVPVTANTIATAIQIGNPVSWRKSLRGIAHFNGVVTQVTDQEILDAKAHVDRAGIGAEPASCATVAGTKKLVAAGIIPADAHVVGVLTGNLLKDPDVVVGYHSGTLKGFDTRYANPPVKTDGTLASVLKAMKG